MKNTFTQKIEHKIYSSKEFFMRLHPLSVDTLRKIVWGAKEKKAQASMFNPLAFQDVQN